MLLVFNTEAKQSAIKNEEEELEFSTHKDLLLFHIYANPHGSSYRGRRQKHNTDVQALQLAIKLDKTWSKRRKSHAFISMMAVTDVWPQVNL